MERGTAGGETLLRQDEADGEAIAVGEVLVGDRAGEFAHEKDAAAAGAKKVLMAPARASSSINEGCEGIEGRSLILDGEDEFVRVWRGVVDGE